MSTHSRKDLNLRHAVWHLTTTIYVSDGDDICGIGTALNSFGWFDLRRSILWAKLGTFGLDFINAQ